MTTRDIEHKLKKSKRELAELQENFYLITENMDNVLFLTTEDIGNILYVNPAYERVWGESRQHLYNNPESFFKIIHPENRDAVEKGLKEHRQGGWSSEYRIIRSDGSVRWIHHRSFPLLDGQGEIKLLAIMAEDITDRKSMEDEIKSYIEELESSNKELEDFAYISSHDLQEPLRKIQTFGGRLEAKYSDKLGEEGRDYLDRMNRAATRMRRLIDDLLNYSRITTKARSFNKVQIEEIVQKAISNLESIIEETGGSVKYKDISMEINANPTQMLQLFQNLIGNSLKFHRSDVPPIVSIYGQLVPATRIYRKGRMPSPKTYRIIIEDNGIGFDEKYVGRIFEPFQRLHGKFQYDGTGMGLAICKKIVDRHGGEIMAKSKPGEGSIFFITFPLKQENSRERKS